MWVIEHGHKNMTRFCYTMRPTSSLSELKHALGILESSRHYWNMTFECMAHLVLWRQHCTALSLTGMPSQACADPSKRTWGMAENRCTKLQTAAARSSSSYSWRTLSSWNNGVNKMSNRHSIRQRTMDIEAFSAHAGVSHVIHVFHMRRSKA